ncbi:hypothetical protein CAPTEDRAFT_197527 [Capitella teleta]|uniref:Uncharacterized protein n=1 Tax=Capitella teleta TaxID=283909 RepID=R7UPU5_CAPTE|nr:hypothetical protein CAPTEDRAFT_197527 [Capitella teleta]|eukprot:ELU08210.1 hypothetical protein CAPTEDRAFT_197527 [Capitella teleta]
MSSKLYSVILLVGIACCYGNRTTSRASIPRRDPAFFLPSGPFDGNPAFPNGSSESTSHFIRDVDDLQPGPKSLIGERNIPGSVVNPKLTGWFSLQPSNVVAALNFDPTDKQVNVPQGAVDFTEIREDGESISVQVDECKYRTVEEVGVVDCGDLVCPEPYRRGVGAQFLRY